MTMKMSFLLINGHKSKKVMNCLMVTSYNLASNPSTGLASTYSRRSQVSLPILTRKFPRLYLTCCRPRCRNATKTSGEY